MSEYALNKSHWTNRAGFILWPVLARPVGLGNIWKFPYMTGTQGGGAFCADISGEYFAIAVPIAAARTWSGRGGQSDAVSSVRRLAAQSNRPQYLGAIGAIGVLGSYITPFLRRHRRLGFGLFF